MNALCDTDSERGYVAMLFNDGQYDSVNLGPLKKFGEKVQDLVEVNGLVPEVIISVRGYFKDPYEVNSWLATPTGWRKVKAVSAVAYISSRCGHELVVEQLKLMYIR
jgi:hypothetical protein